MKIDVSSITGFEGMSDAEKVKALMELDVPEKIDLSHYVLKEHADKYASEAAEWKKKFNSKLTDEEARRAEEEAAKQELENKYNELLKRTTISDDKAKYLAMGYDEKLATETAQALAEGNVEKVFSNGEKFKSEMEKKIRIEILKDTPRPETNIKTEKSITKDQFKEMGYSERLELFNKNKPLYEELTNGGNK